MNVTDSLVTAFISILSSLMTPEVHRLCIEILHAPLFFFSLFGLLSNIINILVFVKQGVTSDSTTVSLFALSVSDMLGCAFMLPQPVCFYLIYFLVRATVAGLNCYTLTTMTCTYPHIICSKITCVITAYISVERAVSVALPLKVKEIVKTRNTVKIMASIFVSMVGFHTPYAASTRIVWRKWPTLNERVAFLRVTSLGKLFLSMNNIGIAMVLTTVAMVTVAVATIILITSVRKSVKWKRDVEKSNTPASNDSSNELDKVLTKTTGGSLISLETYFWSVQILNVPLLILTALGTVTNILNILVFVKQGVTSDSITMSLFAKSSSDFMSTLFMYPAILCLYFEDNKEMTVINFCTISVMAVTYPHLVCMKFTCLITTYISVERAIFVVFPLHVKRFIKVKRTIVANLIMCMMVIIIYMPYTSSVQLLWIHDSSNNNTLRAVYKLTELGKMFYTINYTLNSLFLTNVNIVIIAVSTVVLVTRLRTSRKWRERLTGGRISSKNLEICKTVTAITALYLACLIGSHLPALAVLSVPGMTQDGENRLLYGVIYTLRFDVDAMSSSLNMFFYYKTSSKYRRTYSTMFGYGSATQ
ncbi:hypothetical protein Btru_065415 [Bulinus truncatus]|nr:hypothetical protein Btru_065415 [Bulinus truncatus]